ncbi:MAG: ABC transporter permease [Vicinamibacteria bacterium]
MRLAALCALVVTAGITAGAVLGYGLAQAASIYLGTAPMPGVLPAVGAASVLTGAAVVASLVPAARASRVDVLQALRSEWARASSWLMLLDGNVVDSERSHGANGSAQGFLAREEVEATDLSVLVCLIPRG